MAKCYYCKRETYTLMVSLPKKTWWKKVTSGWYKKANIDVCIDCLELVKKDEKRI